MHGMALDSMGWEGQVLRLPKRRLDRGKERRTLLPLVRPGVLYVGKACKLLRTDLFQNLIKLWAPFGPPLESAPIATGAVHARVSYFAQPAFVQHGL